MVLLEKSLSYRCRRNIQWKISQQTAPIIGINSGVKLTSEGADKRGLMKMREEQGCNSFLHHPQLLQTTGQNKGRKARQDVFHS